MSDTMREDTNLDMGLTESQVADLESAFNDDYEDSFDDDSVQENQLGGEGDVADEEADQSESSDAEDSLEEDEDAEDSEGEQDGAEDTNQAAYTLKYLGKDIEVGEGDVVPLLQKGLNYDHVKNDRDSIMDILSFYAAEAGIKDVREYVRLLGQNREMAVYQTRLNALKQAYPDSDERLLDESARSYARSRMAEISQQKQVTAENANNEMYVRFVKTFPDVKPEDIPIEVIQRVQAGGDLIQEYMQHKLNTLENENSELKSKQKQSENAQKQNVKNKKKSPGSVKGGISVDSQYDDFLKGFNEG